MPRRLVIIGGDAAGMFAAAQARRMTSAGELEIVAFERGSRTSYAACGLPYLVGGLVDTESNLRAEVLSPPPTLFRCSPFLVAGDGFVGDIRCCLKNDRDRPRSGQSPGDFK